MKINWVMIYLITVLVCPCVLRAQGRTETVSGKVYEVYPSEDRFTVSAVKSGTNVVSVVQVKVDSNTQFVRVNNLGGLKIDEPVAVDFVQGDQGEFVARRIEAFELDKIDKNSKNKKGLV